jgi:hypothetical protein
MDWQCCLAGSSKTASRILIFSIAMGANQSPCYVKMFEIVYSIPKMVKQGWLNYKKLFYLVRLEK